MRTLLLLIVLTEKRQRGVRQPAGTAGDITAVSATVILGPEPG